MKTHSSLHFEHLLCVGYKICHTATHRNEKNEADAPVLYQRENKLCVELDCIFHNARQSVQTVTNTIIQS